MKLLRRLEIPGSSKKIDLLVGDLSAIPPEHAVDILIISAFPNDYQPTANSLVGALGRRGLSVQALAEDRAEDLTESFACWLSKPIDPRLELNFSRILCFEPLRRGRAAELVGEVFQALAPFAFAPPSIRSVATPILASGDQRQSAEEMLQALLEAAFNWLVRGFPVETVKIVMRPGAEQDELEELFVSEAQRLASGRPRPATVDGPERPRARIGGYSLEHFRQVSPADYSVGLEATSQSVSLPGLPAQAYDVFISYSRKDEAAAQHLYDCLTNAKLSVFMDRHALDLGAAWQQEIFDALEACRSTAVLYSPDFLQSKVCKDEFNIAWMRRRETDAPLFPILVRDAALPTYMRLLNYADCRTSDTAKIAEAASTVVASLGR